MATKPRPLPRRALRAVRNVRVATKLVADIHERLRAGRVDDVPAAYMRLAELDLYIREQLDEAEKTTMQTSTPRAPRVGESVQYRAPSGLICAAQIVAVNGETVTLSVTVILDGEPRQQLVKQARRGESNGEWNWTDE